MITTNGVAKTGYQTIDEYIRTYSGDAGILESRPSDRPFRGPCLMRTRSSAIRSLPLNSPLSFQKSVVKFTLDQPVPVTLIEDAAKFRAKESVENEKEKESKKDT